MGKKGKQLSDQDNSGWGESVYGMQSVHKVESRIDNDGIYGVVSWSFITSIKWQQDPEDGGAIQHEEAKEVRDQC